MPWVRFDDDFPDHWKIEPLSDGAFRLHTNAIFRSSKWLTDGYLPKNRLDLIAPRRMKRPGKYVAELEAAGLWEPTEDGWNLHDFLDYQPSKVQVKTERAKTAERQKRWRERQKAPVTDGVNNGSSNGVTDGVTNAAPTRPDPTRTSNTSSSETAPPPRDDVERLCEHLADWVEKNGSKRPTVTKKWRDAARLMLDRDGRTEEQVRTAIDWCQQDEFWKPNVMSMPKLREKYDQLRLAAQRQQPSNVVAIRRPKQANDELFAEAYQRAAAREAGLS
ncbi:hypothetical protein AB0B28_08240 [Glycomyces sp. NPDC046736]|uniref:hypothetical protein n=1 Tax=Glycomyces sp. NPDC046736 TaxID=3155615 RepID=UPI0033EBC5BD